MNAQILLEPDYKLLKGRDGFANGLPKEEIGKEVRTVGIIIPAAS